MIQQSELINKLRSFHKTRYPEAEVELANGYCFGLSLLCLNAFFNNKLESFYNKLETIAAWKNNGDTTDEYVKSFFKSISQLQALLQRIRPELLSKQIVPCVQVMSDEESLPYQFSHQVSVMVNPSEFAAVLATLPKGCCCLMGSFDHAFIIGHGEEGYFVYEPNFDSRLPFY